MNAEKVDAVAAPAAKRPPASAALQLLPDFLQAMLYGTETRRAEQIQKIIEAVEARQPALANRIRRLVPQTLKTVPQMPSNLMSASEPRFGLDEVIMGPGLRSEFASFIAEHQRAAELARFKLYPRHRILLSGPPGNGKTMIAEALAKELGLMFFTADYSGLVDSHLGVTSRNVSTLFSYVNAVPCLLFLDEFDAVGADRGGGHDVREFRRVTNQMLVTLDRLSPECVLVAATNAEALIDPALKRRFDMPAHVAAPDKSLKLACAQKELSPNLTPGYDMLALAMRVADSGAISLDEVTKLCRRLRRDAVLNGGKGVQRILSDAATAEGVW